MPVTSLVQVSEKTLAGHRMAHLRGISAHLPGMGFTVADGIWHGEWPGGHGHDSASMGLLWVTILGCPACLEHDWPGWHITRGDGWEASDGQMTITCGTRSALVCRLAALSRAAR